MNKPDISIRHRTEAALLLQISRMHEFGSALMDNRRPSELTVALARR
jgi:hypothetical protein